MRKTNPTILIGRDELDIDIISRCFLYKLSKDKTKEIPKLYIYILQQEEKKLVSDAEDERFLKERKMYERMKICRKYIGNLNKSYHCIYLEHK